MDTLVKSGKKYKNHRSRRVGTCAVDLTLLWGRSMVESHSAVSTTTTTRSNGAISRQRLQLAPETLRTYHRPQQPLRQRHKGLKYSLTDIDHDHESGKKPWAKYMAEAPIRAGTMKSNSDMIGWEVGGPVAPATKITKLSLHILATRSLIYASIFAC